MKVIVVEETSLWWEAMAQVLADLVPDADVDRAQGLAVGSDVDVIVGHFAGNRPLALVGVRWVDLDHTSVADPLGWFHEAVTGETPRPPSGKRRRSWTAPSLLPPAPTQQELRVLRATAAGRSIAEIANELGISQATVASHRRRLYQKWSVHSAAAATAVARARGFLTESGSRD